MKKFILFSFVVGMLSACDSKPPALGSSAPGQHEIMPSATNSKAAATPPHLRYPPPLDIPGEFTRPLWSPDGKKLLLTKEGNTGLFYIDVTAPTKIVQLNDIPGVGYGAVWSPDGKAIFYKQKEDFKTIIKSVDIISKEMRDQPVASGELQSYASTQGQGPLLSINLRTFKVEAKDPTTGKQWVVTMGEGQFYQPLLSPDGTKVAAHSGSKILIFHSDGSGLYSELREGIATSWSPDSKYLLAFYDESTDGHSVTNSELYLLRADGSEKWMLTNTNDLIEMYPSWNPVDGTIAFADDRSGKIFVAELILPE